jgi:hypothetical protein
VRVEIDGRAITQTVKPKGVKSDGASVGELRVPLAPGPHRIAVSVATGPDAAGARPTWSGQVEARSGRIAVLSYEPGHGFEFEP